ncbi:MAG: sulfatase-like hydrolase/transferase [Candidatus Hydrogenedentes bacterium]|nr:sulfatase-like hydrolase/transferase [Candidatus Hydrogenedentota bacterium]
MSVATRSSRIRRCSLAAILLLSAAVLRGCGDRAGAPPARVIWITIDSLRADHLGYAGYDRHVSPNLDALAAASADFRFAMAPSNVTRRSVTAYMTGKHYSQVHEDPMQIGLPEDEVSIAEAFQASGWRTIGCVTNFFLRPEEGQAQGFDVYHALYQYNAPYGTIDEIIETLRKTYARSTRSEFIYIHTMDVHHPYRPPLPYGAEFIPRYDRRVVREGNLYNDDGSVVIGDLPYYAEGHDVQPEDIAFLMSLYDGAIQYTDARLPELLDALAYDPARDMLVITSDHGEQFFEHGFWRHGAMLMPEELHVPLLVRCPGVQPGRHGGAVSLLDLYPTFCELFSLRRPGGLAGESLVPVLQGGAPSGRTVYCETPDGTGPAAAVVNGTHLYSVCADAQYTRPEAIWPFAETLYDLRTDPGCVRNIAAESPEIADTMNAELRRLNARWMHFTRDVFQGSDGAVTLGPDLLAPAWARSPSVPAAQVAGAQDSVRFDAPAPELVLAAPVDAPGAPHVLEIPYRLSSGVLEVTLSEGDGTDTVWRYACRKASPAWKTLRRRVYPNAAEVRLVMRMREPGAVEFRAPSLRRAMLPAAPFASPATRAAAPDEAQGLSDEERQRLETLGYIGP